MHYYDLLPTGDILAVKATDLRTKQSAEKAIEAAVQVIIEEKLVEVELPGKTVYIDREVIVEKIVEVESGEIIDALREELKTAQDGLMEALTDLDVDPKTPNTPNTCLLYTSPSPRDS